MSPRCLVLALLFCLLGCEGTVSIDLTATPPEGFDAAILRINGVRLTQQDGTSKDISLADDFQIDATTLGRGQTRTLFSGEKISSGSYTSVQLLLEARSNTLDSYLSSNGTDTSLVLSAGSNATASQSFNIKEDEDTALSIHLDMRSSLLLDGNAAGDRLITPRLRVIETASGGNIAGDVETALLQNANCDQDNDPSRGEVVYVFSGSNVSPNELDNVAPDPLTTALISRDASNADYVATMLPAGDYTVAISCNADLDDPLRTDGISFVTSANASVTAGSTTTLNFAAATN